MIRKCCTKKSRSAFCCSLLRIPADVSTRCLFVVAMSSHSNLQINMEQAQNIYALECNLAHGKAICKKMAQVGEKFFNFPQIPSHFGRDWVCTDPRKAAIIHGHLDAVCTVLEEGCNHTWSP